MIVSLLNLFRFSPPISSISVGCSQIFCFLVPTGLLWIWCKVMPCFTIPGLRFIFWPNSSLCIWNLLPCLRWNLMSFESLTVKWCLTSFATERIFALFLAPSSYRKTVITVITLIPQQWGFVSSSPIIANRREWNHLDWTCWCPFGKSDRYRFLFPFFVNDSPFPVFWRIFVIVRILTARSSWQGSILQLRKPLTPLLHLVSPTRFLFSHLVGFVIFCTPTTNNSEKRQKGFLWWARGDLNARPLPCPMEVIGHTGYEPGALPSWATGPCRKACATPLEY